MKNKKEVKKKENNFIEGARKLLKSIDANKNELKILKNQELKNLDRRGGKEITLIKEKTKKQRLEILKRYKKGKEDLGKILLKRKNQELGTRLSIEKKSSNKIKKALEISEKKFVNKN